LNNLVEAAVLDVCSHDACVEFTRLNRLGDFFRHGCHSGYQLLLLAPDHLLPEQGRAGSVPRHELTDAVQLITSRHSTPLVAVGVAEEDESPLLAAGAIGVLRRPVGGDEIKSEVRLVLGLREPEEAAPAKWSLAGWFRKLGRG